jgi:hypothetical protein
MKFHKSILLIAASLLLFGCVNTFSSEKNVELEVDKLYKARISKGWHEYFVKKLNEDKSIKKAWALFSYGGWADDGQLMLFKNKDRLTIERVPQGVKRLKIDQIKTTASAEDPSEKLAKFDDLKDVDEVVFDTLNFEYVSIDRTSSLTSPKITHVFIRTADFKKHPIHTNLIGSLKSYEKEIKK